MNTGILVVFHLVAIVVFDTFASWAYKPPMWESSLHVFIQEVGLKRALPGLRMIAWGTTLLWLVAPLLPKSTPAVAAPIQQTAAVDMAPQAAAADSQQAEQKPGAVRNYSPVTITVKDHAHQLYIQHYTQNNKAADSLDINEVIALRRLHER